MRLAHLSDVHVLDLSGVRWTRFVNKRLTGMANLVGKRKGAHPTELLEVAVAELVEDGSIDHVVITGDLSNLSLESEFERARQILEPLAGRLSVIPGNHDVYTRGSQRKRRFEHFFDDWMWGPDASDGAYPWVKLFDEIALIGFSSAVARLPFVATGHVARAQLDRLDELAPTFGDRYSVALVHHNVHQRGFRKDRMHGLSNRDQLLSRLAAANVELLLHGHTHVAHRFERDGITIIGSGSSTWASSNPAHVGRYNVYDIDRGGLRDVQVRRWDPAARRFG